MKKALLLICILFKLTSSAAPVIGNIGYTSLACSSTSRTFTVNITDVSAIATGSLSPRAYYRVNANAYASVSGILTSGTLNNGTWTFNMTYSASSSDFIYLFVTAQNSLGNISANPSPGFAAIDVNTVTSPPTLPLSYFTGVLNGSYTVGAGGNFTRLTDASVAYNTACSLAGPVTFVLTDTAYSTSETFPITFSLHPNANNTNSLLITPLTGTNVNITGSANAAAVIKFLNARYFTLNGNNGSGNGITIRSAYTGTLGSSVVWLAGKPVASLGCKRGAIKNTNVYGVSTANSGCGIFVGEDETANPVGANNDSIEISGNQVLRTLHGILAEGSSTTARIDGLAISSNTVGPSLSTPTANAIYQRGIWVEYTSSLNLNKNLVQNCYTSGIVIGLTQTLSVSDNTVRSIGSAYWWHVRGILLEGPNSYTGIVKNNLITDIFNVDPGTGNGGQGIYAGSGSNNNLRIENNIVSDIRSYSNYNIFSWPVGIFVDGSANISVDNNSVNLFGSHTSTTNATGSAALLITGPSAMMNYGINIRNNILCNTYDHINTTKDTCYAIYSTGTSSNFSAIDNNDYYAGGSGSTGLMGWYLNNYINSIPGMQSSFGGNINSFNTLPVFTSPTDLHLVTSANAVLDNNAKVVSGITTDIDNQVRSSTAPDIGADEFTNSSPCSSASYGSIPTTSYTACSNIPFVLNHYGGASGTGFNYQWQVSSTPGGPYTNVVGGSGATTTSYTTPPFSSGTFYYVLEKTCTSASLTAISNEATVTVNQTPTVTASCNSPVCTGVATNLVGTTNIGTVNSWIGPSFSCSSLNCNAANAGVYTFMSSLGSCSATATTTLVVYPFIQTTVTVNSSTICPGASATISAVGAVSYTWNSSIVSQSIVVSPTISATPYTLKSTDVNGCFYNGIYYVYLYPAAYITVTPSVICAGQTSTISLGNASTYTWSGGQTTSTILVTPTITTTYSVSGVSSTSGCPYFFVNTVSVGVCTDISENFSNPSEINIFPNPSTGIFNIEILNDEFMIGNPKIQITNILGQEIGTFNLLNRKQQIVLEEISSGMYYLKLTSGSKLIMTLKIIKQ